MVLLRRKFNRPLALLDRTDPEQPLLGFAEVLGGKREVWEYAALVTSLDSEILTLGQLNRDRADRENAFDELKNHWGWGGFTTQDLKRVAACWPPRRPQLVAKTDPGCEVFDADRPGASPLPASRSYGPRSMRGGRSAICRQSESRHSFLEVAA